jgi:hypothetical protein
MMMIICIVQIDNSEQMWQNISHGFIYNRGLANLWSVFAQLQNLIRMAYKKGRTCIGDYMWPTKPKILTLAL